MARDAGKTLALTDAEPQYANTLCWAAADVLAVNQFYPVCPSFTSTTTPPVLFPTSQALEAGYQAWFHSVTPPATPSLSTLSGILSKCEGVNTSYSIQAVFCNRWGNPALRGLTFKWGNEFLDQNGHPDPKGLDWKTMTGEIEAGHPVLFVWDYLSNGTGQHPVGKHELVVIGYSEDDTGVQRLQIWDPWPVPLLPPSDQPPSQVPACGPATGVKVDHSRKILFSTYSTPVNDMGVPATAVHEWDQWGLALDPHPPVLRADAPPPPPQIPPQLSEPPQLPAALPQLSFENALSGAFPEAQKIDLQEPGAAPRSLGVPFPIVGLGFQQLLRAGEDPTKLLTGTTSAILFPVESQGKVVDAFLMLLMDGRWQRGGYANIEITQRLDEFRARYAKEKSLRVRSFYMVSVPGEVAFFAAYGQGRNAILIPASTSTDPLNIARAGVAVPAAKQLKDLIAVIRRDLDYSNRILGRVGPVR
jgi:hypothetical protein